MSTNILVKPFILTFFFVVLTNAAVASLSEGNCVSVYKKISNLLDETSHAQATFLHGNLLKKSPLFSGNVVADDLSELRIQKLVRPLAGKKINHGMDAAQKLDILKDYPIEDIVAAPGHRQLRNTKQVEGLTNYIKSTDGGDFSHDKILLNVVTDAEGNIKSVDLWNAHHRLVAYLEAGKKNIGSLKLNNVEVLVNGVHGKGEKWGHYLSSGGVDLRKVSDFTPVPAGGDIRVGTISVDGGLSNFELGSRNTLRQLHTNTLKVARRPKVGVYFGTFDPIHEGHMKVIRDTIENLGLDELVIVPNMNPIHKAGAIPVGKRLEIVALRIKDEPKVNLYLGDSAAIIDKFGRNPFFEHMIQTYGTYDMYQIIGADSFASLVAKGEYATSEFRKYVVLPRAGVALPEMDKLDKARVLNIVDETELSSSKIRKAIQEKKELPKGWLSPEVYQYIKDNGFYH